MDGSVLVTVAGLIYLVAMVFYTAYIFFRNVNIGRVATALTCLGVVIHLVSFISRWRSFYVINGGGFFKAVPISNLYESLQFFALLLICVYLIIEFKFKIKFFGSFATAISGATILFIDSIGATDKISPLVPALQSNWLLAHVSLSFIAYVFFALSAISALVYLIMNTTSRRQLSYIFWTVTMGVGTATLFALVVDIGVASVSGNLDHLRLFSSTINSNVGISKVLFIIYVALTLLFFWYYGLNLKNIFLRFNFDIEKLDIYAYKFAIIGFAIFTIGGLIFGAIWAEQAWGRYWSWDPKETWAFLTWLTYGLYLHGRLYGRWRGNLANSLALLGFIMTIFTFLGVNLLLSGLHSYGSI